MIGGGGDCPFATPSIRSMGTVCETLPHCLPYSLSTFFHLSCLYNIIKTWFFAFNFIVNIKCKLHPTAPLEWLCIQFEKHCLTSCVGTRMGKEVDSPTWAECCGSLCARSTRTPSDAGDRSANRNRNRPAIPCSASPPTVRLKQNIHCYSCRTAQFT